jgi:hypothetical protein
VPRIGLEIENASENPGETSHKYFTHVLSSWQKYAHFLPFLGKLNYLARLIDRTTLVNFTQLYSI